MTGVNELRLTSRDADTTYLQDPSIRPRVPQRLIHGNLYGIATLTIPEVCPSHGLGLSADAPLTALALAA
jgi:hypothetical protein